MNTPQIHAYLFFNGNCEEAIAFYAKALGAKRGMLMRFNEAPEAPPPGMVPEGWGNKIMHADFTVGETMVMASDGCGPDEAFAGFSLSVTLPDATAAARAFAALGDGGTVTMPLGQTFWSPCFGMLKDRFGVAWMVTVPQPAA
jgi:PhnB protein